MLGDISSYRATKKSEGKQSIHFTQDKTVREMYRGKGHSYYSSIGENLLFILQKNGGVNRTKSCIITSCSLIGQAIVVALL